MRETLGAMKAAQRLAGTPNLAVRNERLSRIAAMVRTYQEEIVAAVDEDFGGRAREETLLAEIFTTLSSVRHARKYLRRWMRPERRSLDLAFRPARAKLLPQPLGVVGIISPWNYPLYMATSPLVGAVAAGNRVMVKPSEHTPRTSALMAKMIGRYFAADEIAVIQGGRRVGEMFSCLPFDHLLYTGSASVARRIMAAAAENLTPVTLELGGKSPAIISEDVDLRTAATSIVRGKLFNAGQTCVAPDYVLLPRSMRDGFIEAALAAAANFYPTVGDNNDYSAIVDQKQYDRIQTLLANAVADGANICTVGEGAGRKVPLTLLTNTNSDMAIRREEIFGPLLPLVEYEDLDEAINLVNDGPHPLALYFYGRNAATIDRVLNETKSGGVVVNDCFLHAGVEDLPFGGVGASGMGQYHGQAGFETFSKLKPVLYQSRWNGMWLLYPPYGRRTNTIINLLLKRKAKT